jgi:transposase
LPVDFTGTLQCDGYSAYVTYARHHPHPVTLAACWAHARRKFHDARSEEPRITGWFLHQIQLLYQVEARLREQSAGPKLRAAVRAAHSRMIVTRIRRALERLRSGRLPKSLLGQAIAYTLGQWTGLEIFLTDGRVEIDNNTVENAIRPTAIGKKNWLFVGEAGAGERSAVIYTIIESCRRRGLDPLAYLRDVLDRLPSMTNHQIPSLTPEAWRSALLQRAA